MPGGQSCGLKRICAHRVDGGLVLLGNARSPRQTASGLSGGEMKARAATIGDLEGVFSGLSKRMSDEYVAAGKDSRSAYDNLMMNLKEGRAHALVEGNKTVAIIAWHERSEAADTLFAAQEDFFSAATVRFCRRHIRHIQALAGNLPIHSRTWLNRADVSKWFRVIGYVDRGRQNGFTLFELPPAAAA
jgi:hypothetical protein